MNREIHFSCIFFKCIFSSTLCRKVNCSVEDTAECYIAWLNWHNVFAQFLSLPPSLSVFGTSCLHSFNFPGKSSFRDPRPELPLFVRPKSPLLCGLKDVYAKSTSRNTIFRASSFETILHDVPIFFSR